ncbi:MAG TPA: MBL fold metallo-hydrolase [Acidobacteriaceae bacterium]|nr:MBL fold metallo-hydrolase [Acidobacteriaceae bacterium]
MAFLRQAAKVGRKFQNPVPTNVGGFSTFFRILPLLLTNKEERVPGTLLGPFTTDASLYDTSPASGLRITWMGHSSTLVEIDGVNLLIDPVWDERASPSSMFGPKRFFAPTLGLKDLPRIDAVLLSHDHYDHLGKSTVRQLAQLRPDLRWITSLGVGKILQRFGVPAFQITELDWTQTTTVASLGGATCDITSLPSRHFSGRGISNRFETLWASFVLRSPQHSVYFGADSGFWEGFAEIGAEHGPFDLTMLEIGAYNDLWKPIHMGPDGAAAAFKALGAAGLLMPIHWGLFDLALHGWRQPIEQMLQLADAQHIKLWSPHPGQPTEVVADTELRSNWWHR